MRLALGFCGQFAKATFSSISIQKLEVRRARCSHRGDGFGDFSPPLLSLDEGLLSLMETLPLRMAHGTPLK